MKSIFKILSIYIGFHISQSCYGCQCVTVPGGVWEPEAIENAIGYSDVIFIGKVINANRNEYAFKVIDLFKGESLGDTLKGKVFGSCSIIPQNGIWIVYASLEEGQLLNISTCGFSRSLTELNNNIPPLPPPKDSVLMNFSPEEYNFRMLPQNLKNWINEYAMLIGYRNKNMLLNQKERESGNHLSFIALAIAFIALIFSILNSKFVGKLR